MPKNKSIQKNGVEAMNKTATENLWSTKRVIVKWYNCKNDDLFCGLRKTKPH